MKAAHKDAQLTELSKAPRKRNTRHLIGAAFALHFVIRRAFHSDRVLMLAENEVFLCTVLINRGALSKQRSARTNFCTVTALFVDFVEFRKRAVHRQTLWCACWVELALRSACAIIRRDLILPMINGYVEREPFVVIHTISVPVGLQSKSANPERHFKFCGCWTEASDQNT
jgi:hypothetical protein